MPSTVTDLIRRTRFRLNEPAYPTLPGSTVQSAVPRFWTDQELLDWINDASRDIARRVESLLAYNTTLTIPPYTLTGGQVAAYALPTEIERIFRVEFNPTNSPNQFYPVQKSTANEMDQLWGSYPNQISSYPNYFVLRGFPGGSGESAFSIQLFPQSSAGGTLILHYYRQPARLSSVVDNSGNIVLASYSQALDLNEGYDDLVLDYVTAQALLKAQDERWQPIMQSYESKVTAMINVTRDYSDQPKYMVPGRNFGVPAWLSEF